MIANIKSTELSIKIELTSFLNNKLGNNHSIKRIGGENSINFENQTLFPDLLFFDVQNSPILGCELKLGDDFIDNDDFFQNALRKSEILNTNSFIISDLNVTRLFKSSNKTFELYKEWKFSDSINRNNVDNHLYALKKHFWEITLNVIDLIDSKIIKFNNTSVSHYTSEIVKSFIENNHIDHRKKLERICFNDKQKDKVLSQLWNEISPEFPQKDKFYVLTNLGLFKAVTTTIFILALRKVTTQVDKNLPIFLNSPDEQTFYKLVEPISKDVDFQNILLPDSSTKVLLFEIYEKVKQLISSIEFLKLEHVDFNEIQSGLNSLLDGQVKQYLGHYNTSKSLGLFMLMLGDFEKGKRLWDPCCGSGTIPYQALKLMRNEMIPTEDIYQNIVASDKFHLPVAATTMVLSNPKDYIYIKNIFKNDILEGNSRKKIKLFNPIKSCYEEIEIGKFDIICSNLPFVRSEKITNISQIGLLKNNRRDIFADIILKLDKYLKTNAKIVCTISNSWLGTEWGKEFWEVIIKKYDIEYVITETNFKLFSNVDVIPTILSMKKLQNHGKRNIKFVKLKSDFNHLENLEFTERISAIKSIVNDITDETSKFSSISNIPVNLSVNFLDLNLSKRVLFYNHKFWNVIRQKIKPSSSFSKVIRGERWGNNNFFHLNQNTKIEKRYLKPLIKSEGSSSYLAKASKLIFCCPVGKVALKNRKHYNALKWIDQHNMSDYKKHSRPFYNANFVTNLNPSDKLIFQAVKRNYAFVDQRYIIFTETNINKELLMALLNSSISLLFLEFSGFPRSLGALDLNVKSFRASHHIPDPNQLTNIQQNDIINAFKPLLRRKPKKINDEFKEKNRLLFESKLYEYLGIPHHMNDIINLLIEAVQDRTNRK